MVRKEKKAKSAEAKTSKTIEPCELQVHRLNFDFLEEQQDFARYCLLEDVRQLLAFVVQVCIGVSAGCKTVNSAIHVLDHAIRFIHDLEAQLDFNGEHGPRPAV